MIVIGSKAFEFHGIHLPRPKGYVSDIDLIMDEREFAHCQESGFLVSWETTKGNKILAYDKIRQKYEIELLKRGSSSSWSHEEDTIASRSSKLLHSMQHKMEGRVYSDMPIESPPCSHCGCPGDHHNAAWASAGRPREDVYCWVPSKEILFALKKSHVTFPINWYKNISDYHYLKDNYFKDFDIKSDSTVFKLYMYRKQETNARIKTKVDLQMSNEEFFNQHNVNRLVNHDKLHEMVAMYDVPMHTKIRKDQDSAYCDESLWNQLTIDEKYATVQEEACVIALERAILPKMVKKLPVNHTTAYNWAIMRICTTLTKGWFREFAVENWTKVNTPPSRFRNITELVLESLTIDIDPDTMIA